MTPELLKALQDYRAAYDAAMAAHHEVDSAQSAVFAASNKSREAFSNLQEARDRLLRLVEESAFR